MKQFPYAQQIIWENDVEQIEWVEDCNWYESSSCLYLVKLSTGEFNIVRFRKYDDECVRVVSQSGWDFEVNEVLCWAKL